MLLLGFSRTAMFGRNPATRSIRVLGAYDIATTVGVTFKVMLEGAGIVAQCVKSPPVMLVSHIDAGSSLSLNFGTTSLIMCLGKEQEMALLPHGGS